MTLYIPDQQYEFAFVHSQQGTTEQAVVTLGIDTGADLTAAQFGVVNLAWINHILPLLSNSVSLVETKARNNIGNVFNGTFNIPGGETDPCASYNNAYLVHKETSQPGRTGRGRMYLPGVNEVDVSPSGQIATVLFTPMQASITAFFDELLSEAINIVLFHSIKVPTETPPSTTVNSLSLDARTASQRGRLRR